MGYKSDKSIEVFPSGLQSRINKHGARRRSNTRVKLEIQYFGTPARDFFFPTTFFVHGSKCQFIDGINLNLTHVCVCCEIIFVFTYISLVVFVYKVKQTK